MTVRPFRTLVPIDLLQAHRREAELILRAGAAANALLTIGRSTFYRAHEESTLSDRVDTQQLVFGAAAFIYEFYTTIDRRHGGLGWELVAAGETARVLPFGWTIDRVHKQFDNATFVELLGLIRDKGFAHWDPQPFTRFLESGPETQSMELFRLEEDANTGIVFSASYEALMMMFDGREDDVTAAFDTVSELVVVVPYVAQAMLYGFLRSIGRDPETFNQGL